MADKPLKSITFPGLADKYTIPEIDSTLTQQGEAADAKKTGDEISGIKNTLSHKADLIYDTASGDIASFPDGADGMPVKDLTVGIEPVQAGSGDPSPDNVRPISGWMGANVSRTGVNVWDGTYTSGKVIKSTNGDMVNEVSAVGATGYIPVVGGSSYYLNVNGISSSSQGAAWYDSGKNFISGIPFDFTTKVGVITAPANAQYFRFSVLVASASETSMNYPSSDSDYHAYAGETIPISWQSEAGTVYGGTLDVTTGVLTVDRAAITIDDTNGYFNATNNRYLVDMIGANEVKDAYYSVNCICDTFIAISNASATVSGNVGVYANSNRIGICGYKSSLAEYQSFLAEHPVHVIYKLKTIRAYQLTPEEVTTLLGQNNIWSDTGDSTVEYPADTKLYIDKKLAALVAALS